MSREREYTHRIALLATGDEIIQGDILNSNAKEIASRLSEQEMHVGMHMTVSDNLHDIEKAIHFLLKDHEALIMTGGLGPTSDDLTRFALSNAVNLSLVFDETVWHRICERLNRFGHPIPPESNRQQALFPENATVLDNPHGTAAGCMLTHNERWIFMLPGPPVECLAMFDTHVLPALTAAHFKQTIYRKKWLLKGISEAKIAEELDALAKPYDCITGYRACSPYLEFKLRSYNRHDFETLVPLIEKTLLPYLITRIRDKD
jgi:molybdenum cofactor synthesis domain-containing protein